MTILLTQKKQLQFHKLFLVILGMVLRLAAFDDNGTLGEVGKAADFVILNDDIFTVAHSELKNIHVNENLDGRGESHVVKWDDS